MTLKGILLGFQNKCDDMQRFIGAGKEKDHLREKAYLSINELNNLIPHTVPFPEDLDDLLTTVGTECTHVLEGQPELPSSVFGTEFEKEKEGEATDDELPKLAPGALEASKDPVRIYLREMAAVPLLTGCASQYPPLLRRARTAARAEGAFTLAHRDPPNPGHWRGLETRCPLDQGNRRLPRGRGHRKDPAESR
jgi:hypothetical protein